MAGEQSDPAFKAFFHGEWKELIEAVQVPGMPHASWDRKAAYLFYLAQDQLEGLTGCGVVLPDDPAPTSLNPFPLEFPVAPIVGKSSSVGYFASGWAVAGGDVNPVDDADCAPDPEGVSLGFNSGDFKE